MSRFKRIKLDIAIWVGFTIWEICNFFRKGFGKDGYIVSTIDDKESAYKYSLLREYRFFWIKFTEPVDIFLSKKDLDRKIHYMTIYAKNYYDIFGEF